LHYAFSAYASQSKVSVLAGSDGEREVVEGDAKPVGARDLGGDVIVAAAQVLYEGMSHSENPDGAVTFQPAHRPQPRLQPSVVCLDRIVRVPLNGVQGRGNQFVEHSRADCCAVCRDLDRDGACAQRAGEEAPGGGQVAPQ